MVWNFNDLDNLTGLLPSEVLWLRKTRYKFSNFFKIFLRNLYVLSKVSSESKNVHIRGSFSFLIWWSFQQIFINSIASDTITGQSRGIKQKNQEKIKSHRFCSWTKICLLSTLCDDRVFYITNEEVILISIVISIVGGWILQRSN